MTPYEGPLGESVKEISLWTGRNCRQNQTFLGWGEDHTVSERNPSNYTIPYEQPLDNNEKKKAILIWRNLSFANHLPALFNVLEDINTGKLNLSEEGWGTLTTVMFKIWCLHGCSWSDVPQRVCMCDINKEKMNYREQKG